MKNIISEWTFLALENLQYLALAIGGDQFGPGCRIGREPSDEVVDPFHGLLPIDVAGLFEDLWSRAQFASSRHQLLLGNGLNLTRKNLIDRFRDQAGTYLHEGIMHLSDIVRVGNGEMTLQDDAARIDLMLQEEGGHTRLRVSVDHSPVDGGCAPVLRQEGGMEVEGA